MHKAERTPDGSERLGLGGLALVECSLKTRPGDRILLGVRAVGAIPGHCAGYSTTHTIYRQFSVFGGKKKLFAQISDERGIEASLLTGLEYVIY
jgi:hypothetical protein